MTLCFGEGTERRTPHVEDRSARHVLLGWLPNAAAAPRAPIAVLSDHTRTQRPQEVPAVSAVERTYGLLTEIRAGRLAELVDETAVSLCEIATLHRRVDGRG